MKDFLDEFKAFAMRGNVMDLAVAVVIGAAFGKIVSSLVEQVIMPVLGVLTGRIDFSEKVWVLRPATDTTEAVAIGYGAFLNAVLEFLIVALAVFIIVKQINRLKRQKEEAPPEAPPEEIMLLREIRDSLKR